MMNMLEIDAKERKNCNCTLMKGYICRKANRHKSENVNKVVV